MMIPARKAEALMAAAVYDELTPDERIRWEKMVASDPALQREFAELRSLTAALPVDSIAFEGDLTGVVLEELRRNPKGRREFNWTFVGVFGMSVLVIGAVYMQFQPLDPAAVAPDNTILADAAGQTEALLDLVQEEAAQGNFSAARKQLTDGLSRAADPQTAGRLQLALADLEFGHGERYAEAYEAYRTLREQNFDVFSQDPVTVQRFEILAESAPSDFAPIYAYDAAVNNSPNPLLAMETLVAAHPEKKIAQLAILAMEKEVAAALPAGYTVVAALEAVRDRCVNASARARLDLAIGEAHWTEGGDKQRAAESFRQAINGGDPVVARLAEAQLAQIQ